MKKSAFIYIVALLSGVILYSCKPSDEKLQKAVETVLITTYTEVTPVVKDGTVTLTGTVESEDAKAAAEKTAKTVKNIKSVINNIQVVTPPTPVIETPDDTLVLAINSALSAGGFSDIIVAVSNGEVTLTGEAKETDLPKILQIANESKPAKVINQIKVK